MEPDFMDLVESMWRGSHFLGDSSRIFALKLRLRAWNKLSGGFFKEERKKCITIIRDIDALEEERTLSSEEQKSREYSCKVFLILAVKEKTFWRQRSRIKWLKEDDHNTKFFHKVAPHHKSSNDLCGLWINGEWSQNQEAIRKEVESYYMNLFKEDHPV